jgi:hypothetical protein
MERLSRMLVLPEPFTPTSKISGEENSIFLEGKLRKLERRSFFILIIRKAVGGRR